MFWGNVQVQNLLNQMFLAICSEQLKTSLCYVNKKKATLRAFWNRGPTEHCLEMCEAD